jgi:putative hydrolase of the HAD superfamily
MNIIIPLGGKGERFSKNGYTTPKPLIQIYDKNMIEYVLDNLNTQENDKIFIIYNKSLETYNFSKYINSKYSFVSLIEINDTKGAVETLFVGIEKILQKYSYNKKCLILDCDTFYTEDIRYIFNNSNNNMVFYTKKYDETPIYSYIELNHELYITNIKEKTKISDNANTGAYAFTDIHILYDYCKYVLDNNITFNNEPYTSCVISEMIKTNILIKGYELKEDRVFSLGTPYDVEKYINNTYAFLFDLDGTIVITDDIYFDVWKDLLIQYNIILTKELFNHYIQGNNDKYVTNTLLKNIDVSLNELSILKDKLFIKNINKIQIIDGIHNLLHQIRFAGYKACIVTNSNREVANAIIKYVNIDKLVDFVVSNNDVINCKPNSEPYIKAIKRYNIQNNKSFIFEDSKTGLLSANGVCPKLLIGLETIYDTNELKGFGCDLTIENYMSLSINDLINNENTNIKYLKKLIIQNSIITNIKYILIDEYKLKGGFIADVIGFKITTYDNNYSLILKYENDQKNNLSDMAKQLKLYDREYYFYTNISKDVNICIPKFYNLIIDNNKNIGITLENLIDKNYKLNLNLNLEKIDITLKIVDRMSKLHSKFWNKNLEKMFPKLKNSTDTIFCPFFSEFIGKKYEIFKKNWSNVLNNTQIKKCDDICKNFTDIQRRFSIGNNLTFIHGDIKSPNIFYDISNNYEPYFIDWQHCGIGKGVQDLIFFIIESFDITNIKSMFYLLKEYYYKKLLEYGVNDYSFEEYENDIHDAVCYIPFFTSIWFGTVPQDELIDKNFPYFFISKMCYLFKITNIC